MNSGFLYFVHGFTLESEIECPELSPASGGTHDVQVRYGSLDHLPVDARHPWRGICLDTMHMLLNIKDVGRFSIRDGREIIVDPTPNVEIKMLRLFLVGTALGCVVHQRGLLPLHANAFIHNGEAVLVLARSGVGKSTLAAAMKVRGYKILADDVCAVKVMPGKSPEVYPGVPQIKLRKDAAMHLGEDVDTLQRIARNEEKYALPVPELYCAKPVKVKALYLLNIWDGNTLEVADMARIDKISELRNNTYRKGMVAKLGIESENLRACAALAQSTDMRRIYRPKDAFLLNELTDLLEKDLL